MFVLGKTHYCIMRKHALVILLAIATAMSMHSCKKSKGAPTNIVIDSPVMVYADYTALKPGNYWIYEEYFVDSVNGAGHPDGQYDSSYVEKDTLVNGKTYHKYCTVSLNGSGYSLLRDSLSYTVNLSGAILFSSVDFTDTFVNSYFYNPAAGPDTLRYIVKMGFKDSSVTVDAGTFKTVTTRQIFFIPPSEPYGPIRENDTKYAVGIGMIIKAEGFFSTAPSYQEFRLQRYHVQ